MQPADAAPLDAAAAAEAIRQAALRYCRGVDRLDAELMRSAYHDDATDDHGVFVGSAADLCTRVMRSHRRYEATMHCVLNHAIEITDDSHATGEVYNVTYLLRAADGGRQLDTWWGRYLEGTLFEADPELCVWVSAPRPSSHHRISRVLDMPSER